MGRYLFPPANRMSLASFIAGASEPAMRNCTNSSSASSMASLRLSRSALIGAIETM